MPYKADRQFAREVHEKSGPHADDKEGIPFIEVYVDVPVEVAEQRDPKGLYKKARAGEIKEFTGISAPYEAPENPDIHLDNTKLTVEEAVAQIVNYLTLKGLLTRPGEKLVQDNKSKARALREAVGMVDM